MCHVINREARRRIVIDDRASPIRIADRRVDRSREMHRKRFVRLELGIAVDQHRDLLGRLIRSKVKRSAIRLVIRVRYRARSVRRLEVH